MDRTGLNPGRPLSVVGAEGRSESALEGDRLQECTGVPAEPSRMEFYPEGKAKVLLGGGNKPVRTCGLDYMCMGDRWRFCAVEGDVINHCLGALLLAVLESESLGEHISH